MVCEYAVNPVKTSFLVSEALLNKEVTVTKAAILTLTMALSVPACFAVGAIARNPQTNVGTVIVGKSTKDAAEHDAILACGSDCEIVITFQNSCAAYAADFREKSTVYGHGQAGDKYKARRSRVESVSRSRRQLPHHGLRVRPELIAARLFSYPKPEKKEI